MKIKNILFTAAAAGLMVFAGSASATPIATGTTYTYSIDRESAPIVGSAPFGSIVLTQGIDRVTVDVSLLSPYAFAGTGAGNAFAFSLGSGFAGAGVTLIGSNAGLFSVLTGGPFTQAATYGTFTNAIKLNSTGLSGSNPNRISALDFTVSQSGISLTDFIASPITDGNKGGYLFVADIGNTTNTNTGLATTTGGVTIGPRVPEGTPVPEPTTLALLGLGLLGFAAARRRKN